ncbi:nuclear pore complex protein DDB_G0274915 isoform X3 [Hermetia illucens]|nr:nuclear pore complex protein DDB_G0274915 isoform X3 [Hermetia illucens]XP_037913952.1 nuclear pore complex protein DDB_G0274915 isoform X3 [Hermetia illucens]XP_037913953.1 nuclear pore complex protein DDB_G0274915 isoform X3 [Hermetia illucens]XP_037913954.1 nuclear pore complex protein DDB_G0274915 isoform X3 [Hermetia illucens]XP_037913955.1 nuclear pore complex protein DDB_G0274915 isoform X3 [Hermetia illucens]XP_037913956.1 nuclear pore complex protein DDB_G0274915 isoform X3 [Hermet
MSPERPPSQSMGGTNIIEQQPQQQQLTSAANTTTATNMVLSTIPIETGHVVIHHQTSAATNGTNGTTYTQITRNGVPQNLISTSVVSSSPPQLTTKTISAMTASSPPSKYVVIHQNGSGQYRTADGTAAILTTQSNGVGNIVLLATEPLSTSEQSNIIVNTSGQGTDEELTPLTWLQDKDLLKDLVVRPNGTKAAPTASPSRQSNGNGGGAISPTSDFMEDSSVSEDNASSANSSSDQGISISSSEFSPTSSTSSSSSVPNSAAAFSTYHHPQQTSMQYHQVTVAATNQNQAQISAPHFINNNTLTKNRNHLVSPTKPSVAFSQSLPANTYTITTDVNAPKTVTYNGKSGTTTVVEYKAGTNFSPPSGRQIVTTNHTMLSPQRSPPISGSATVTITSATSTPASSQTSSPNPSMGVGGGNASSMSTSTPSTTPHQHFHKKYIREQMNGAEQQTTLQRNGNDGSEYGSCVGSQSQQQHHQQSHFTNGSDPDDFHRTPIKSEPIYSNNNSHDDRLMARESLNFDSPTATPNGRSLSMQKANSSSSTSSSTATTPSAAASPKQKHPTNVPYDPMVHTTNKPPYSFSSLIFMAIEDSPEKALPVKEIYAWIVQHFPYFKTAPTGWKNSVRHNLSLNKSFLKVEKAPNMGKGSLWRVEEHQRQNLMQALARSPFHQSSAVDKFSPYKTNPGAVSSSSRSMPPESPPTPCKSNLDPELFPKLYNTIKNMANKGVIGTADGNHDSDEMFGYNNGVAGGHNGTRDYYATNGGENGAANNSSVDYSIERLARDCGADSIDDVNAATAMLALKHGPNIFSEHFQNGSPVITSSPSEDHTYSAGGGGNGGGSSTTNSATHSQNGSDNNSSGVCSDAAYESGDERLHPTITAEELEERRRHAEGVDALLSFASSAASSPNKRPSSTPIEEEHIASYTENIPLYISTTQNGATTTRYVTNDDGSETVVYHHNPQRLSSSSSSSTAYETSNYYLSSLPSSTKKMKSSRVIRPKMKRKTTLIR